MKIVWIAVTKQLGLSIKIALLVWLLIFSKGIFLNAQDLGNIGKTFPILEEDLMVLAQKRAKQLYESGQWQKKFKVFSQEYTKQIFSPPGVKLPRAFRDRKRYFDTKYRVAENIYAGKLLIWRRGEIINPLDFMVFEKTLCFFDAEDSKQVEYIEKKCPKNIFTKLILTSGKIFETAKKLNRRVYFDQGAALINKLKIRSLPAIVSQEGNQLVIKEVAVGI